MSPTSLIKVKLQEKLLGTDFTSGCFLDVLKTYFTALSYCSSVVQCNGNGNVIQVNDNCQVFSRPQCQYRLRQSHFRASVNDFTSARQWTEHTHLLKNGSIAKLGDKN